jgi:hypothetical protein
MAFWGMLEKSMSRSDPGQRQKASSGRMMLRGSLPTTMTNNRWTCTRVHGSRFDRDSIAILGWCDAFRPLICCFFTKAFGGVTVLGEPQ